jgi:hypothetical protein
VQRIFIGFMFSVLLLASIVAFLGIVAHIVSWSWQTWVWVSSACIVCYLIGAFIDRETG